MPVGGTTGAQMLCSWSAEDDLLTLSSDFAGTTNDVSFTNTFTPAHQWASSTISNASFRLTPPAVNEPFATVNVLNQYPSVNGSPLYYDTRGNLNGNTPTPTFGYDPENRLMGAAIAGLTYAYDPSGRRTQKAVSGTTTNFVHDGDTEIAEYDGSGTLLRRYVPGPAIDDYVAMVTAAGVKTFFHTDKMGSVIAMSDTSGNLAEGPYTYDSYGNCRAGAAACSAGVPFRYTGQRLDPEISGYYYRARVYNPVIGRFYQTDPVGYDDDLNAYTYVGNDPTDKTDPSGETTYCTGWYRDGTLIDITPPCWDDVNWLLFLSVAAAQDHANMVAQNSNQNAPPAGGNGSSNSSSPSSGTGIASGSPPEPDDGTDVSWKRNDPQRRVNWTTQDLRSSLRSNGYNASRSADGNAEIWSKGNRTYTIRPSQTASGGSKIELRIDNVKKVTFIPLAS